MEIKPAKHLLIVTPGFPESETDTVCLPAVQQFLKVYKQVYPETIISVISLEYPYHNIPYQWEGIMVYPIGGKNKSGLNKWHTIYKAWRRGVSLNRESKIDAVLSLWLSGSALSGKRIAKKIKTPHLIWMHGQDAKAGNKFYNLILPKADDLAAISDWQNDILHKAYGMRAKHVINNGINESEFPDFNTGVRDIDLLAVGSLIPLKQFHLFIEVVKFIRDSCKPLVKAVVIGKGPEEQKLRELIRKYELQDNISLTGEVPHDEVLKIMNKTKVLVHPSEYEGHSTVMIEALYSGCKVAAFMPLGEKNMEEFRLCVDLNDLKSATVFFLKEAVTYTRVKYTDLANSVKQVQAILLS